MTTTQLKFDVRGKNIGSRYNRYTDMGKGLSSLSSLALNFYTHEVTINRDFHSFVRQLRDLPKLKELNLCFDDYYSWDDPWAPYDYPDSNELEIYRMLSLQLKYLSHITTLKISIYNKFTNDCFKALADGIRHFRNLSSFTLDIKFGHSKLSKRAVQKFAFAISRLNKFSHFDLSFRGESSPDCKWNKILWRSLGRLENLATLDLNVFPFLGLDRNSIKIFFESFKNKKRLSNLKLNFAKCSEMSTEMTDALLHGFKYLGKLQIPHSLNNQRERERLRRISEGRYFGLNLKELTVSFPSAPAFLEEGVKGFAKFLLSMKRSLKFLSLDLKNLNRLTDEEMLELFKHLSNLELLVTLKLRFSDKPLTDYFFKSLSYRCSYLLNLSDLQLDFQRTSQITNKGLRALSEGLSMIKNLSHLDLDFGLLPKVTDSSLQAFFYGFENLTNLEVLKLDFSELPQVNEKTIYALAKGLMGLDKLKELNLDVSHCLKFTNKALESLANGIRNVPTLGSLRLDIYDCKSINEKGIKYLAQGLEAKGNMSHVWLDIYKSESISDEFMREISKQLKRKTSYFSYSLKETDYDYLLDYARRKRKQ